MRRSSIVTVTSSPILSAGLSAVIRQAADGNLSVTEADGSTMMRTIAERHPVIVVADMFSVDRAAVSDIREAAGNNVRILGVLTSAVPADRIAMFDDVFSIYDPREKIAEKISRNLPSDDVDDKVKELSPREKEVIVGVVKGLSNKEIADEMNVSANTVMTHRRNIAAKLQIHSPAGLTIYAIVSNLVNLDDIKGKI